MMKQEHNFGWATALIVFAFFYLASDSQAKAMLTPVNPSHGWSQPFYNEDEAPTDPVCPSALLLSQKKNFYEGLAVLAQSNLTSFFLPENRKRLHGQLFEKTDIVHQQALWFVPETSSSFVTVGYEDFPEEVISLKEEMDAVAAFRGRDMEELSESELERQLSLERELHRKLFAVHQGNLDEYPDWAFHSLNPMKAYQRIFENYVSSSVWWNHYVVDYAGTVAAILGEQIKRMECDALADSTLWASAGDSPKEN